MIAPNQTNDYDVIVVGAGISGINFGYRLQEQHPGLRYAILEGRDGIGGTWDFFKYPGLRSDSDLYTFGFPWRPWSEQTTIAQAPLIVKYVRESAEMFGIDKKVLFRHHVMSADWSSAKQNWTLSVDANGESTTFKARFVVFGTGYYDYEKPLKTVIPGIENFQGKVVHPQFWPTDLDYTNKQMVIIGSGATAVTMLPALAQKASRVTMLQRSPSFVISTPREDGLERFIRKVFPIYWQHKLIRFKWLVVPYLFINFCYYLPNAARNMLRKATSAQLPPELAHDPHFNPSYNPFEQRVCFCPDGDFYGALRSGKGTVVTDTIKTVTENSIRLNSGQELHPDIIVTATGLQLRILSGIKISVDGRAFQIGQKFLWKNVMLQDLPNAAYVVGYVDASWTLGADASAHLICRMLRKMKKEQLGVAVPRLSDVEIQKMKEMPVLKLTSTYVTKAKDLLPKAGNGAQWSARTNYFNDWWQSRFGDIKSGLEYIRAI